MTLDQIITTLEIERWVGRSTREILRRAKRSYRRLAKRYHPDLGGDEAKFRELARAWEEVRKDHILTALATSPKRPPRKPQNSPTAAPSPRPEQPRAFATATELYVHFMALLAAVQFSHDKLTERELFSLARCQKHADWLGRWIDMAKGIGYVTQIGSYGQSVWEVTWLPEPPPTIAGFHIAYAARTGCSDTWDRIHRYYAPDTRRWFHDNS